MPRPLLVRLKPPRGVARTQQISDVEGAMEAISRDGLGGFNAAAGSWQEAMRKLGEAKLNPTPDSVRGAREAVRQLALTSNSLLDG